MSNYLRNMIMNCVDDERPTPLSFMAESAGATVKLTKYGSPIVDGLQYRMGTSGGWTPYTINTVLTLTNVGDVVQFQNTLEELSTSTTSYVKFVLSGQIAAVGNIMSMLNYIDDCKDYCYYWMFSGCSSLTSPPELPATTLGVYCYAYMFYGCYSLNRCPELPATTLANYCYEKMFYNCTRLRTPPELPATTLANHCYSGMFYKCSSLTLAPELPATTLANNCYDEMFYNCSSLTTPPELPATTLASNCYSGMFKKCSLDYFPELPAKTLATSCYGEMFEGNVKPVSAPELPATTLANYCYSGMFKGCTKLTTVSLPATTLYHSCYVEMLSGCTGLINAPELPATTLATSCYDKMFSGCTGLINAPKLPATQVSTRCYAQMFYNCSSLTSAPELPATTLANYCYEKMFYNCTKLNYIKVGFLDWNVDINPTSSWTFGVSASGTFEKMTALTEEYSTSAIPTGWTVVNIDAPSLPEDTPQEGTAYKVDGAGTTFVNGTYVENGTYNGNPQYEYVSGGTTYKLQYPNSAIGWIITDGNITYYTGKGGTTPDTVTSWSVGLGIAPAPTVTKVTDSSGGDNGDSGNSGSTSYAFKISGLTTPTEANGNYIEQSTDVYKHETNEYYVSRDNMMSYWCISPVVKPSNPSYAIFYGNNSASIANPWEVTAWTSSSMPVYPGAGTVVITKGGNTGDDSDNTSLNVTSSDSAISGTYSSYENVNGYPKYSKEGIPTYYIQADSSGYYEMFSPTGMSMYYAPTQGTPVGKYTLSVGGTSGAEPTVTKK